MSVLQGYDDIVAGDATIDELGVKAVDDSTLEVTLKQPTAYFNELLTLPAFMPLREDMVGSDDSWSKDPTRTVSNGPFTLAGYTEGKELVLCRKMKTTGTKITSSWTTLWPGCWTSRWRRSAWPLGTSC